MPETEISVQGHHSAWYPAERAVVAVAVQADGPERDAVVAAATRAADAVRATIEPLHHSTAGPITWWSADTVRVWSQRPWNDAGAQLDPVHYAALEFSVKFSDFGELGMWIEAIAALADVAVTSVSWSLTAATATAATVEARSRAVKDAVAKATVYAQSIGLGTVTASAIADPGMLADHAGSTPTGEQPMRMMKAAFDGGAGTPIALKPEQLEIAASVDARFIAQ